MLKKVIRIGNSLGLILPARYVRRLKISENSVLKVTIAENTIVLEVVPPEEPDSIPDGKPST